MIAEVIDVHSHCFLSRSKSSWLGGRLAPLRAAGLHRMVVVGLVNTHLDSERMWNFIPRYVDNQGDPRFFEVENLLGLAADHAPTLLPFVDTRHLRGDPGELLAGYMARGFRGVKGIYLADDRNDLGVRSYPETFGISLEEYQRLEWEIFAFAEACDLPLVYHMDVRLYGDVTKALLDDFPRLRVDFAHFGISRKALGGLFDRYPNVYTDLASMLPHLHRDPRGYRDFILHYPERVCFGTDTNLYAPETVLEYIGMVRDLRLPPDVEARVFSENPRRFLGSALP
jgi:hypothetical protein